MRGRGKWNAVDTCGPRRLRFSRYCCSCKDLDGGARHHGQVAGGGFCTWRPGGDRSGLIDLAMYQGEKDRLKARLEDWWLRFTDVRWSNFGRREAELAIEIIDRRAGPRLWSWRRWRFAAYVSIAVAVLTAVWVCLRALWSDVDHFDLSQDLKSPMARLALGIFALSIFVAFAISLSVTRYVAVLRRASARRLCGPPCRSPCCSSCPSTGVSSSTASRQP